MKSSNEWISLADMMTGLMMIFLFISVLYLEQSLESVKKIKNVSKVYIETKDNIYKELEEEFRNDLKNWNAKLIKDELRLVFLSPQIMFDPAKSSIKNEFKIILNDFCPRYFILLKKQANISEIRIEGHTSNEWNGADVDEAYFKNMKLSQDRTRSVLKYCVNLLRVKPDMKNWMKKMLTANGLSSSKRICTAQNKYCRQMNRRVDFRVQIKIKGIIDAIQGKSVNLTTDQYK